MDIPFNFFARVVEQASEMFQGEFGYSAQGACIDPLNESALEAMFCFATYVYYRANDEEPLGWKQQLDTVACGHRYRLDRAFVEDPEGELPVRVAVELDGHAFHERTPEQVAARNTRDADLLASGWFVLHFSWHQVMADPFSCVRAADAAVWRERVRVRRLQAQQRGGQ